MPKAILIQHSTVGVIYRFLQVSIIAYFIGWVIVKEKGYQASERPIYGVSATVRGTAFSNAEHCSSHLAAGPMVYTDADLVQPPIQNSGFFLVTRVYSTVDQVLYACAEAPDLLDARCRNDAQCPEGQIAGNKVPEEFAHLTNTSWFDVESYGHGPFTGRCLRKTMTCEVIAWCPILENTDPQDYSWYPSVLSDYNNLSLTNRSDHASKRFFDKILIKQRKTQVDEDSLKENKVAPLYEVLNFTVLIRNIIEFPFYKIKRNNILGWMNNTYLKMCRFNVSDEVDRHFPRFRIQDVITLSGADIWYILLHGGIIDININWDCDLDKALENTATDERDIVHMDEKYYLEFGNYFTSSQHRRLLHKFNGIQFLISVTGKGGRFSLLEFSMKIGSCMALFGTATLLCNLILIHFSPDRRRYKQTVYRLRTLTKCKGFIKRSLANLSPPKPALNKPKNLETAIEFYAGRNVTGMLPGFKINIEKQSENCAASITEEDRQCPSIIQRKFVQVNLPLKGNDSPEVRLDGLFRLPHPKLH
ncbi:P2X purinoceptor 4 [Echinococcus granulosus]|uniref:P2X purinoceptor 4 n=1 Tax=Echinococcus granulosus TaxID=6210 RepID=A0A068WDP2_ECHGR|nr:P2X purinoceptor 4 [Echinococcus granulosus]CDS15740.1 p2X purinoceptor 4 [Echinococcus granulosus]